MSSSTIPTGTFDNSGSRETISQLTQEVERLKKELNKVCCSKSVSFLYLNESWGLSSS